MEVQSLSICVPGGCPNNCKFCVSKMHDETYPNQIEKILSLEIYMKKIILKDYNLPETMVVILS